MNDSNLGKEQREQIEAMKRAVWSQKGAGEHYHYLAYKKDPVIRLKNLAEIRFVLQHVRGPLVLDAGAGTGRFTLPLRKAGLAVFPLDLSRDMLSAGVQQAHEDSLPFPATCGDIGKLPYADNTFDSLVSITVLRHFPNWEDYLREYVRVVRPGGRIIFDMGSGDQKAYLKTLEYAPSHPGDGLDPLGFDAGVTLRALESLAEEFRVSILHAAPHDPFNDNHLLKYLHRDSLDAFESRLHTLLEYDTLLTFCELLQRRFLSALGPALCSSLLIILEKSPPEQPFTPPFRGITLEQAGSRPVDVLDAALNVCLARRYGSYLREATRSADGPPVREFLEFCENEILSRLPLETLKWEAK